MIYVATFFAVLQAFMQAIPFIIWQVACLFVLFFVVYKNRISWVVISVWGGLVVMLALGYHERKQQWRAISREHVELRLGPGCAYPRQGTLSHGDKVSVLQVKNGWSQVEHNGVIGWVNDAEC